MAAALAGPTPSVMMLSPTPTAFVFLVALLPLVSLSGPALARRITRDRTLARLLAPALALSLWLLAIHITALATGSFWIGLPVGTFLASAIGAASLFRPAAAPPSADPPEYGIWLSATLVTAFLVPLAVGWEFHDEVLVTGHLSIASAIQNGHYPPRHLSFPQFELRYHYGFDLLVATVASMLRLRVNHAIDLVTLLAWGYSWCLAWAMGKRFIARGWGGTTAAIVLLGGGLTFFSSNRGFPSDQPVSWVERLVAIGAVGGDRLNGPIVSCFFQHPWTLGIPLGLATILVVAERTPPVSWARWAAIGLLLGALSFCQAVLFVCLVGVLLVTEPAAEAKFGWKRMLQPVVLIGAVLLVASRLHGFFAPLPPGADAMFELRSVPIGGSLAGMASWHLQTFGLLLPLGLAGIFFLARERLLVLLLVGGSLMVLNVLHYRWSWDIVKFATVASLGLSLGASASLQRLFELRPRHLGRAVGMLAAAGLVSAGISFAAVVGYYREGVPYQHAPSELSPADEQAIAWLRRNVRPGEIVYRRGELGLAYTLWGGLPQLWGHKAAGFPWPRAVEEHRLEFFDKPVSDPGMIRDQFLDQRVRWVVVDPDEPLLQLTDRWIAEGRAVIRARFEPIRIVELLGEFPAPSR